MEAPSTSRASSAHSADRRVRELYRFYRPSGVPSVVPSWLPSGEDVPPAGNGSSRSGSSIGSPDTQPGTDDSGASNSSATSRPSTAAGPETLILGSSNNTLTSFCQLAALRLNVERAMICVFDRDTQFILAEATQSVNLNDNSIHKNDDELWLGSSASKKGWKCCQDVVALPPSDRETPSYPHLVVNDLAENERYNKSSFVAGPPHFRFFAGTPLTTENRINLGCFFVLDTKPRDELGELERDTLGSLSFLVMDYMKICRQASEGRRAARLSRGLSYFVDGSSSFVNSIDGSRANSCPPVSETPSTHNRATGSDEYQRRQSQENTSQMASNSPPNDRCNGSNSQDNVSWTALTSPPNERFNGSNGQDSASQMTSQSPPNIRSLSNDSRSLSPGGYNTKFENTVSGGGASGVGSSLPEWITNSSRNRLPPDDSHGNSWCFRRAANLLRESLDLSDDGGVLFLEATQTPLMDGESGSDCSMNENSGPATVLSMSTNDDPFAPRAGSMAPPPARVDRTFLRQLLRRYPQGKLWSLHRDGLISTSDDDDQRPRDNPTFNTLQSPHGGAQSVDAAKPLGKRHKAAENSMLNQYFPGATQIMFVPLWNAVSSQWFAGCFCWTTVETQVFTSAVEVSSVLGFGSSIMAEYSRVESLIADRQKGDFIGSISHELRSPLHGILAAAEFLNSTKLDEFQDSLLETLCACGRTLLDTMNQVLDFSKVVSLERTWRSMKRKKESPLDFKGTDRLASHLDTYIATDLSIVAEEVVEGITLGLAYGQNSTAAADLPVVLSQNTPKALTTNKVEVMIDIANHNWVYRTQPGALRRIIMNIFGNAMKYTDEGRVTLSLEALSHSEGRSRRQGLEDLVTLTVTDTGRGISEEFLRDRLYTPFAQENSLAVGTGLGLSIVRSLVKALNGNIRVRSRPGEGTIVRVSLPLARPVGEEDPPVEPYGHQVQQREILAKTVSLREKYPGRRAAIWGADPDHIDENSTWAEIGRYLREWFGVEIVPWPTHLPLDMLIVEESELPVLRQVALSATLPSLLILGSKAEDYSKAKSEWLGLASSVNIIRRPCGPHKLARCVTKCFQNARSTVVTPSTAVLQNPMDMPMRTPPISSAITSPVGASFENPFDTNMSLKEAVRSRAASLAANPPAAPSVIFSPPEVIAAAPVPPPLGENNTGSTKLARVLVVDDNYINLNLMMTFMKKRNLIELASAENGKLAVEAVERVSNGFDVIFMDISMPVMNGFEATRAIRAIERERDGCGPAIIIALTGLSSSRDESEALASGVDMFLTKPVSFREVSRLLDEWEKDGMESERRQIT
ncbi:hypothetical protein N7448_010617 [Penicillium atrosanguineum]|uniref:histidine kinase n=1 Tax=Penicillium atrosanguineum TaxID=1132637 RepID=A0A9W9KUE4_9EURO|nr:hypothetical protein N7526_010547 [Penicillium atrosanguineum]KAJ5119948.1 hypothetical protein N7448_010617 [Penicillium atrosanguineum]KAJ5299708.1 hypothetical protein N7476_011265 [Penicillium atrosanguineum]